MKRIIYATKGWKKLQADYIHAQLHMIHTHKLQALLPLDISGFGFRQAASHYTLVSHAPAALLRLPECDPTRLEAVIGGPLPVFDAEAVLPKIDPSRKDRKIQQY